MQPGPRVPSRGSRPVGRRLAPHSGDVVKWFNTEVCKTSIHRFESGRRLHILSIASEPQRLRLTLRSWPERSRRMLSRWKSQIIPVAAAA